MLGRPAIDVAYYYTSPGFRDHCSRLTGVLEFWTAPCPTQRPASAVDSGDIRLILLSSNRFEPSFLGADSRLTQQTPAVRRTAGSRFAIQLDRFLKARALTSQVRLGVAQFGPVSNLPHGSTRKPKFDQAFDMVAARRLQVRSHRQAGP